MAKYGQIYREIQNFMADPMKNLSNVRPFTLLKSKYLRRIDTEVVTFLNTLRKVKYLT